MVNKINISPQKQILIVYIFLALVTVIVFGQVCRYNFINLDDNIYVTENFHIRSGLTLDGLRWAFSTTYAEFWHPLTWLSLMLDYEFYGLNAGGYHLTSLILHILSALLLFWLFKRMTGAIWKSAFVAAFFAFHPLHVQSVAWISERKDVLSAFFWMLTLCLYIYYTERPVIKRYLIVLISFMSALMSKPMAVTLPVVMILLDYWPLGRFELKKGSLILCQLKEKTPFFILSAVFSILTLFAQRHASLSGFPLGSRLVNAPVSFVTYLEKIFMPHDLAVFYPFSYQLPVWQVVGAALLIIIISAAVIVMMRRLPYLFVGWFWYTITLLPVIGIIPLRALMMADHYTYLPSIGIAVGLAWSIPSLVRSEETKKNILFPAAIAALSMMAVLTWQQCGYWKNSAILFNHNLQITKNNYMALNSFGLSLYDEGKIEEAIEHYNRAIFLMPDFIPPYINRGNAYAKLGRYQPAIEDYNEVIRIQKPAPALVYMNRGNAYADLGKYHQAIEDYDQAISLNPEDADAYNNRGSIYGELGRYREAVRDYNEAIRIKPDYIAYFNRGIGFSNMGQYQSAIEDFNRAVSMKPDLAFAYHNRGIAFFKLGENDRGCFDAQKACKSGNCKLLENAEKKGYCR
ncbi:MAG: tetratricopeptide repeat protein [Smithella sp.]|jgi:tetratricopeptide (TPR) repeat protein